jgi:lipopolysaccharide export system permease protein
VPAVLKLLDRQLVRSYLKSYAVCLVSLIALYIVIDLFNNIDDFTQRGSFLGSLKHIARYYGYMSTHIFDRLSEAIVLLAAMFTVAWMQRNNELLPQLSAGVSTRRVVRPVLLSACALVFVNVANQEFLIPSLRPVIRDDPDGEKRVAVQGAFDGNGIHLKGETAVRREQCVNKFVCTIPEGVGNGSLVVLQAREARYVPPGDGPYTGGWLMTGTQPPELPGWTRKDILEMIDPGKYFLHTADVDFDVLTRDRKWFYQVSTWRLYVELERASTTRLASMAVFFHQRLTRPLLGMILVVMGLSVILRDQNRNVFISAGLCLVLCAVFFGACLGTKYLGDHELLAPALAAWLPVFVFGPLAFVQFDAIHT